MPKWLIAVIIIFVILCCCIAAVAAVFTVPAVYGLFSTNNAYTVIETQIVEDPKPFGTDEPLFPDLFEDPTPTAVPNIVRETVSPGVEDTLQVLKSEVVPENNPIELAERLLGLTNIPETVPSTPPNGVGTVQTFWVSNVDTNENFEIDATLEYEGEHIYFWVENGVSFRDSDLQELARTFDQEIYPTNREFFGSEWDPGIDEDPKIYIVYAGGLGSNLAGYFSSADSVPPEAHEYSNAHEMFLINSDNVSLGEEYIYSTLAHEFQHMIHWYRDRNEESWLNEGFSELATLLNGYGAGGFDFLYMMDPDLQLNDWPNDPNATSPHYGSGFLFTTYFLDRFGDEATQSLVSHDENGLDSVDLVLDELSVTDPATGDPVTADDVVIDWLVTNYVNDPDAGDGRYYYNNYSDLFPANDTESFDDCPLDSQSRTVHQYGVDYIRISCGDTATLDFEGSLEVGILPEDAHSGVFSFWSNKGDESDMTLTQEFDLTGVSGEVTIDFWTWYDLEEDYDYLYLMASEDGGDTWQILQTPSGTDQDPSGNSYGWGYNGMTNGWIQESVDISQYAGKTVQLRFEYITDAAVNGEGLLLDDVSIPQIGYSTDFETDDGGWEGEGFVRIENRLPQTFRLALIHMNGTPSVEYVELTSEQTASVTLEGGSDVVLVVTGTTRYTRQDASYRFSIR